MQKGKFRLIIIVSTLFLFAFSCNKKPGPDPGPGPGPTPNPNFAKGADVSWVTEMESAGKKFYNSSGTEGECMSILKGLGMNAIRLRVWVNPAGGWNGTADVV